MEERFDHGRGRWVAEHDDTALLPSIPATDRWRGGAAELNAWRAEAGMPAPGKHELEPYFFPGLLLLTIPISLRSDSVLFPLGIASYTLGSILHLRIMLRRLQERFADRFGNEEGTAHVNVEYSRYNPYGSDTGVLFLDDDGSLVFDGIVSSFVLPAGAGRRTIYDGILTYRSPEGGLHLKFTTTGTWGSHLPIIRAYLAATPLGITVDGPAAPPLTRLPGWGEVVPLRRNAERIPRS